MAQYQTRGHLLAYGKDGRRREDIRALADKPSVFVPRPLALLELASVLRQSNPKEAANVYQQIKKEFPESAISEKADRGLDTLAPEILSPRASVDRAPNQRDPRSGPSNDFRHLRPGPCTRNIRAAAATPKHLHPYRSEYARDRDRIIHARAFRRLEAKTQVFTTRFSDHFRNRLTHTLEVSQIARTVASALGLNAELVEALALVHDIGHPPFGHAGERKLDELMRPHGGSFNHNLHALRIVEQFEQRYLDFPGLNLTFEVREGIIKHSREYSAQAIPAT